MTNLDPKVVELALRENEDGYSDGLNAYAYEDYEQDKVTVDGVDYPIEVVETDPGGEGHGASVHFIIKVGDEYFRKQGYYASHYGTDWDGAFEKVAEVEKTVKVWERVV